MLQERCSEHDRTGAGSASASRRPAEPRREDAAGNCSRRYLGGFGGLPRAWSTWGSAREEEMLEEEIAMRDGGRKPEGGELRHVLPRCSSWRCGG